MVDYNIIDLPQDGQGSTSVNLPTALLTLVTRYNYSAECWTMDILDSNDVVILAGIMLVPNTDLLRAHPHIKASIGTFVLVELDTDAYKSPDLLGIGTALLWYAPGAEIVIP